MKTRAALPVALWLCASLAALWTLTRAHYVADLSAFLPAHPTPLQRLLVDQLREGPASRVVLAAIEGGDARLRARAARALAARLRASGEFTAVEDGESSMRDRDREFLFAHRYVLSDAVTPQRFTAAGLERAIGATLDELAASDAPALQSVLAHDPTGETLHVLDGLQPGPGPRTADGVWTSRDGRRALLVAATRAAGSDTDAQAHAIANLTAAFAGAAPDQGLRLRLSGPGVFAVRARAAIETAVLRLSTLSSGLVIALLFAVYRSWRAVALGLLPVVSAALAGITAVALGFGVVHGVTLGFGATLIGEAVDYSIYFFVQSAAPEQSAAPDRAGASAWLRDFWPTVRLGMFTSVCGFAALLASDFPGLAQLGAYSIAGLLVAALVTRFVLPPLMPRRLTLADLTPAGAALQALLGAIRAPRLICLGAAGLALLVLAGERGAVWNRELASLSPVAVADQEFDAALRGDLGLADVRDLVIVTGADEQHVLGGAERAAASLGRLVEAGRLGGFDSPVRFLPSLATQAARRASLPDAAALAANVAAAARPLGLRAAALAPFETEVAAARAAPPLVASDLAGTSFAVGFGALVLHGAGRWTALLPLHPPEDGAAAGRAAIDVAAVRAALAADHCADAIVLDLKQESDALYAGYLGAALRLSACGLAAILALLGLALRSWRRVARVVAPLLFAVLCVAAALVATGQSLTILHLVGLLLIVAVGSNYALFFDRAAGAPSATTIAALGVANLATVLGFGLLAFAGVPVLEALGRTVAPGALLALLFAALWSRGGAAGRVASAAHA
jgi:predicted exporter